MTIFTFDGVQGAGGGGVPETEFLSGTLAIASGTTAPVTITCPAGKKLRLDMLQGNGTFQTGVTLTVGAKAIFTSATLDDGGNAVTGIRMTVGVSGGGGVRAGERHPAVYGNTDEDIVISFDATTTANLIYSYGVIA